MIGLGHGAGLAVAAALQDNATLPGADVERVRAWLAEENVALDPDDDRFPPPEPEMEE